MNDVKRFYAPGLDCLYRSNKDAPRELIPLVLESDYAKLEAEAQALREQNTKFQHMLTDVVAKNFAKNIKRSTAQKSMDDYLSEGIRLLEEEVADARRDAERHELRANQYSEELAALRARLVIVPCKGAIRAVFLRNGFTIKEGHADLKPYVYAAAEELLRLNGKAVSEGLLRKWLELMEHGDFREGHCMCGSAVDSHGIGDGHSPVDAGEYYAGQVMEELRALLGEGKEVGDA